MNIFTIIAIGIIGSHLSITIKSYRPEYGLITGIVTGVIILSLATDNVFKVIEELREIISKTGIDTKYFKITLKVIGISYITQFASEICKDAGENAISSKIEAAGKICVMLLTVPVISGFLNMIINILDIL